jgi:hypothetical protein
MASRGFREWAVGLAGGTAIALLLAGCGGGGDGDGPPIGSVDVTQANQDQLARAAAASAQGGFVSGNLLLAGSAGQSPLSLAGTARKALLQTALSGSGLARLGRARVTGVLAAVDQPCIVSGSASITLDDRDNSGAASPGDVVTAVFNTCSDIANEAVDGTLTLTLNAITTSPAFSFSSSAVITALTLTLPGHSARYDGDFTMSYSESSATLATTRMIVGSQLRVQATTANYSDTFSLHGGYLIESTYDAAALPPAGTQPGLTTTTANGTVASALAGGYVVVTTLEPMLQYDMEAYPRGGHLDVVGKSGSLQLTVLPGGQVRIDLDANGDGAFDQTKTVDWDWIF